MPAAVGVEPSGICQHFSDASTDVGFFFKKIKQRKGTRSNINFLFSGHTFQISFLTKMKGRQKAFLGDSENAVVKGRQ